MIEKPDVEQWQKRSGHLLIIGGGYRPVYLMQEFIMLAGGFDAKLVVMPVASAFPELTGQIIKKELEDLGCCNVDIISAETGELDNEENLKLLEGTKGVFFSGGDQNRLAGFLLKTRTLEKIKDIYEDGGTIAGTSAGAAIMSEVMISGSVPEGSDYYSLSMQTTYEISARLSKGFGFLNNVIIDQHFNTRNRTERLKNAVTKNPDLLGIGIDESTAIIVYSNNSVQVIGENKVTIVLSKKNCQPNSDEEQIKYLLAPHCIHTLKSGEKFFLDQVPDI